MEFAIVLGLDIAAAAIIIYCMCAAARKGFLRTVVQMVAYVVIIFVASTVSSSVAPVIYNHFVEPMLMNPSGASSGASRGATSSGREDDETMKNADLVASRKRAGAAGAAELGRAAVPDMLTTYAVRVDESNIPAYAMREVESDTHAYSVRVAVPDKLSVANMGAVTGEAPTVMRMSGLSDAADAASSMLSDTASAASSMLDGAIGSLDDILGENVDPGEVVGEIVGEIADAALRPLITSGIRMVAFVLIFAVLSIVANIVLGMLGIINHLPVIGKLNSLLGGAVGILQGLLIVWMLALLLRGLLNIYPDGVWKITQEIVDATHLFKYFANPGLISGF